ncbi:hypothetical protein [Nostoc sp.]|uniref:hypothetical protein n=1 Tax=Nostoc sp. TaxID=1180 RepID=UPI002FF9EF42
MSRLIQHKIPLAGVKPFAGNYPVEFSQELDNPKEPINISHFLVFSFRFLIGSIAGAFLIAVSMYKSLLAKIRLQS